MKRWIEHISWWWFAPLTLIGTLAILSSPFTDKPSGDLYMQEKTAYQEKAVPPREMPMAEIVNIPPECEIYTEQITRYYLALAEGWEQELCSEYGLSDALYDYIGADPLQEIGFCCTDLNADGVPELLIGSLDPERPAILELWTVVSEKPKLIAQAEGQSRYYLRHSESTADTILENITGSKGQEAACFYFTFNGVHLEYLWDIFPDVSGDEQEARRAAAAELGGERILPNHTAYAALNIA